MSFNEPERLRDLNAEDRTRIARIFDRLRDRFAIWRNNYPPGDELELVRFAYYEGCRSDETVLEEAAPLAVLQTLVEGEWEYRHSSRMRVGYDESPFTWRMTQRGADWDYAVVHELLDRPITSADLQTGEWTREEYDEPMTPGEIAVDALWYVPLVVRWKRVYGKTSSPPEGTSDQLAATLSWRGRNR